MSCRRKGGATGSAGGSCGGSFAVADIDDRELSAAAQERVTKKAAAERSGATQAVPAASFPWAFFVPAMLFVGVAMYLTIKFS